VPVRVAAVAAFDPAVISGGQAPLHTGLSAGWRWTAWTLSAVALDAAYLWLTVFRMRLGSHRPSRAAAARRYAARLARSLRSPDAEPWTALGVSTDSVRPHDGFDGPEFLAARQVCAHLAHYLELAAERPPGALTPE
jgi:hypothetical protein